MTRRANSEGSIYRRGDGRWAAVISLGNGKRKGFYGKRRQDVAAKLTAALKAQQDGLPLVAERQTVGAYLESWLEGVRPSLRHRTFVRYCQYVRRHAVPELGHLPLAKLTPQHLQRLYTNKLEAGLSKSTVHHLHAVLHRALKQATLWGLVPRNAADLVTAPPIARHEMATLSPEQARTLLDAASGDRLEALYVLALTTGMRQGELLGLRWRDVDPERGTVQVRGSLQRGPDGLTIAECKTSYSRRQVALTGAAVEALRRHRVAQAEERLRLGPAWDDRDLVFCNEVGCPIDGGSLLRRSFLPLLEKAGLPRIRFHDLRHTAATLLLGQGVHPKIVSDMLGHSRIAVTLDLYSHVTPDMQGAAVAAMEAVLEP